jgi:indole-3-glycerol phosphate synthase
MGGASLLSILTEEDLFLGGTADFKKVRSLTSLPLLRKDFLFSEYQLYESALLGADAILLITAILEDTKLKALLCLAHELGLKALVECRDEQEIVRALDAGASILGINNRDLRTFEINLKRTEELSRLVPAECILISESGILTPQDAAFVARYGADAILVGESCVRSNNPKQHIQALLKAGLHSKSEGAIQ